MRETDRLLLRPWQVAEAAIQRELWTERDPRVPPHRRIDADGHPTLSELEEAIRSNQPSSSLGLLALERKDAGDVIGYCGLIESGRASDGLGLAESRPAVSMASNCRWLRPRVGDSCGT